MQCPKCDATIARRDAIECPHCGVILAKAASGFRVSAPPPAQAPQSSINLSKILVIAAVIIVAWWLVRLRNAPVAASDWYDGASGFDRALSEQRSMKKPLLLYFHTDWCGYCKKLEGDVFNTSAFTQRYPSVIKVRLNPEKGPRERELARAYGIRGYPTVFVLPPSGGRSSIEGYGRSSEFYARLDNALR